MSHFSKRLSTFVWALFECTFFSSIVVGWTWLAIVFRGDGYFLESTCNITKVNVTSFGYIENTGETRRPKKYPCRPRRAIEEESIFDAVLGSGLGTKRPGKIDPDALHISDTHSSISRIQDTTHHELSPHLPTTGKSTPRTYNTATIQSPHSLSTSMPIAHKNESATVDLSSISNSNFHRNTGKIKHSGSRTNNNNNNNNNNYIKNNNNNVNIPPFSNIRSDTMTFRKITQPAIYKGNIKNNEYSDESDIGKIEKDINNNNYPSYQRSAALSSGGTDRAELEGSPSDEFATMSKVVGYCYEQNERIQTLFAVVLLLRDLLAFPMFLAYDNYGTTRMRLITVLVFAVGTLMMTFTSHSFPWLVIPALTITGLAGSAVFLTNLQTANLFGRKRHVVISIYVGAAYSNGIITMLMKLSHFNGFDIQTSFMILTIAIVPILVSTVAFLPKTRIPWPLPADYGKRRNQSLDEAMLRRQRAWQRRMSDIEFEMDSSLYGSTEAGLVRNRKPAPQFSPLATQSLFVWSVLWFSCQRLQEAVFETHIVDIAPDPLDEDSDIDMETYYGFIQLLALLMAPLCGLLIDRDPRPALGLTQATQHMQRIVPAIVTTSMFGLLEVATDMMYGPAAKSITIIFNILHKVFTYTTMCAFVMHLHFNHQILGKLYGLTLSLSAVMSAFQFPIRTYLIKKYDSMFPAHILLLILNLVALAHAINAWDHCRKRLIKDQSDNSSERFSRLKQSGHTPTTIHIETDDRNLPGNHGDRLAVSDFTENSMTEVSAAVSSLNAPLEEKAPMAEMMDLPAKGASATDHNNGGSRLIFSAPFRDDDDDDDDDEVYGDEDFMDDVKRGYNGLQTIDFV